MERKLTIRPASVEDDETLGRVHAAAWRAAYAGLIPQSYLRTVTPESRTALFRKNLAENYADYYLASDEGNAVGLLILTAPRETDVPPLSVELAALYLTPLYWGQGYGAQMMDFVVRTARQGGCQHLLLWVLEENRRARKFYENYGYVADGTRKVLERGRALYQMRYRLELEQRRPVPNG